MVFLKVDKILNLARFSGYNKLRLKRCINKVLSFLKENKLIKCEEEILNLIDKEYKQIIELEPVINATGIIIHTNLGRSVISKELILKALDTICAYSNLEFDLKSGKRGSRNNLLKDILYELFSYSSLVVNNNAAAIFLIINTLAKNKEILISRGELVEIGDGFRIPEIIKEAGALIKEVGTTNKTNKMDYLNSVSPDSSMILKVHTSNFKIQGFCKDVSYKEIIKIANENNLIDYYDLGSGNMSPLLRDKEDTIISILKNKPSIISFSGDKLLGLTQAGIILAKDEIIEMLKKNQLLRMLRVDKITISLLIEGFKAYINKEFSLLSSQNQIHISTNELRENAKFIKDNIKFKTNLINTKTFVGGGSLPDVKFDSIALEFSGDAKKMQDKFRQKRIIGIVQNDKFLLDFRAIFKKDLKYLIEVINSIEE